LLDELDLSRRVPKNEYKSTKAKLELELSALQRRVKDSVIPVIIVFEGWDASGKSTLINELILHLDSRGFSVHSIRPPNEEETLRPFLWRFWIRTPARGRIAIFHQSWYRRVLKDRVDGLIKDDELAQAFDDISSFEHQLADDGVVIIKFFVHITKAEQKRRFKKLQNAPATAWRVTKRDLNRRKRNKDYTAGVEEMLDETDSDFAPWTVVEGHDRRFATLKVFTTVVNRLKDHLDEMEHPTPQLRQMVTLPETLQSSILDTIGLTKRLEQSEYRKQLKGKQKRLRELQHTLYIHRIPAVIVFEGWDAAGKGGNIRRLIRELDPRGYDVVPTAAPNDIEKAHHYLWRFWAEIPKAGHLTIFDRSWYGRVLVERVEGFCTEAEWKRAYREINEMEKHLTHFGAVMLKFWLEIDAEEQLQRFQQREILSHKQWKITGEDWRNREKWDEYKPAVEDMLLRTSTLHAPWIIVESNCKWYARVKVLDTVIKAIERRLKA
jgi:AMP-polyphosphate phosphotransferase